MRCHMVVKFHSFHDKDKRNVAPACSAKTVKGITSPALARDWSGISNVCHLEQRGEAEKSNSISVGECLGNNGDLCSQEKQEKKKKNWRFLSRGVVFILREKKTLGGKECLLAVIDMRYYHV